MEMQERQPSLRGRLLATSRRPGVLFVLAMVAAFLVYLRTLAPGLLSGDSGEFQFAAWGFTLVTSNRLSALPDAGRDMAASDSDW